MGIWDEYRKNRVVEVSFEEVGLPDLWMKVRHPGSLLPAEHHELNSNAEAQWNRHIEGLRAALPVDDDETDADKELREQILRDAEEVGDLFPYHIAGVILSWNVPAEDGETILQVPSVEPSVALQIPIEVAFWITGQIQAMYDKAQEVPKAT